jgi:hypothetical protein
VVEDCHAGDHGSYGRTTAGMRGIAVNHLQGGRETHTEDDGWERRLKQQEAGGRRQEAGAVEMVSGDMSAWLISFLLEPGLSVVVAVKS